MLYEVITQIVKHLIDQLGQRLNDQQIKIEVSDEALNWITDNGYDPQYGGRPLQRFVTRNVETPLAKLIIADKVKAKSTVKIELANNELTFE